MSKFIIAVFILTVHLVSDTVQDINIDGYYWREYAGEVPYDALPGGVDYNGSSIYIGQILHDGRLSPAKIYPKGNKAYYGWNGAEQAILCSQYPERFVWVKTKHNEIHLLTNYHIVLGGHHPGKTMYIGRVHYKSETSVGKVSTGTTENKGLYITQNGEEFNFHFFEILAYNKTFSVTSDASSGSSACWYVIMCNHSCILQFLNVLRCLLSSIQICYL